MAPVWGDLKQIWLQRWQDHREPGRGEVASAKKQADHAVNVMPRSDVMMLRWCIGSADDAVFIGAHAIAHAGEMGVDRGAGDAFGGRDHGTVIHACKLIKQRMVEDEKTRQIVSLLDSKLQR